MCGCFGKLIGLVLGFVFVMVATISIWQYNVDQTLIEAGDDIETVLTEDFYDAVVPYILPAIASTLQKKDEKGPEFQELIQHLDQEDWNSIVPEVLPSDYVKAEVDRNMMVFLEYVDGESARLNIEINTEQLRENLLGRPGDSMVNRIFIALPICDATSEAQMRAYLDDGSQPFPYCKPADTALQSEAFAELTTFKDTMARDLPDTWRLREKYADQINGTIEAADEELYLNIQRPAALNRKLYPLNFLIPVAILALIIIFAVDSGRSFLRWMGWPLLLSGIFVLIPLGLLPLLLADKAGHENNLQALRIDTIRGALLSFIPQLSRPILVQGTLMVACSFLLLFVSFLLPEANQPVFTPPPPMPPANPFAESVTPSEPTVIQTGQSFTIQTRIVQSGSSPSDHKPPNA